MYFERRELIQTLDLACYVLFVYVWLLDGRTLWLGLKCLLQLQFCSLTQMQTVYTVSAFLVYSTVWNSVVAIAHLAGPAVVSSGKERSILLDFVGQQHSPSRLHMLAIDMLAFALQLLLTTVAYEVGKDELRAETEASGLDVTPRDTGEPQGQGWDVRDEEATLFTQIDPHDQPTSISHPIAVIRPAEMWKQLGDLRLPTDEDDEPPPPPPAEPSRPDTSRIRRFSRPAQPAPAQTQAAEASVDDSWPPMWLVIARNMVGTRQPISLLRQPSQAFTSLRTTLTSRFSSTAPEPRDP